MTGGWGGLGGVYGVGVAIYVCPLKGGNVRGYVAPASRHSLPVSWRPSVIIVFLVESAGVLCNGGRSVALYLGTNIAHLDVSFIRGGRGGCLQAIVTHSSSRVNCTVSEL